LDAEFFGFVEVAAGLFASEEVGGLAADAGGDFAAVGADDISNGFAVLAEGVGGAESGGEALKWVKISEMEVLSDADLSA
jgi:hypothetical protein